MKHTHLFATRRARVTVAAALAMALAGCTASQQTDALVIGAEALPCTLHALASARAADTVANAEGVALVLLTDPACTALVAPTLDLIKSGVMGGKAVQVAPAAAVKP